MKMFYGKSASCNVKEAASGLSKPKLIVFTCSADGFEKAVSDIEQLFPGVPSIGCVGMGYDASILESGVSIMAFSEGVTVAAGILECVSNLLANEMFSDEGYSSSEEDHCMDEKCSGNEGDRGKGSSGSVEKINIAEKVAEDIIRLAEDYEALVVVSNDIFQDSIIYDESVEEYIRGLGMINRSLAGRAETVTELVCGIPVEVKG